MKPFSKQKENVEKIKNMNPPTCKLPKLGHLSRADFEHVYEPAEDTYLFVDTLHYEQPVIQAKNPLITLEIGGGSGCLTAALGEVLQRPAAMFVTDINPVAAETCAKTAAANELKYGNVVVTDLVANLGSRLAGKVDILLFNPPYVVTSNEEIEESLIARSWAGGDDGRQVLNRLLPVIPKLMSEGGLVYLVAIEENKPDEICSILTEHGMSSAQVLTRRTAMNERLMIIKAVR